jgi:hypothetical protein
MGLGGEVNAGQGDDVERLLASCLGEAIGSRSVLSIDAIR